MTTRAQLEKLIHDPNARKMLDIIASAEGTTKNGYYTNFGGSRMENLNAHPETLRSFTQTDGKTNKTSAAGRYQFLSPTWKGLAKQYGLTDFSEVSQDIGALALIAERGALNQVLQGDFVGAIKKIGNVWASLPSSPYKQKKRSWDDIAKYAGMPLSSVGDSLAYTPASVAQAEDELFADNPNPPDIEFDDAQQAPVLAQTKASATPAQLQDTLVGSLGVVPMQTPTTLGGMVSEPQGQYDNTLVGIIGTR